MNRVSYNSIQQTTLNNRKPNLFSRKGDKAVLADFTIKKLIGKGAFGKVFLIEKTGKKREIYAMKSIEKERVMVENLLEETKLENWILKEGDHPFLMRTEYVF